MFGRTQKYHHITIQTSLKRSQWWSCLDPTEFCAQKMEILSVPWQVAMCHTEAGISMLPHPFPHHFPWSWDSGGTDYWSSVPGKPSGAPAPVTPVCPVSVYLPQPSGPCTGELCSCRDGEDNVRSQGKDRAELHSSVSVRI